MLEIGAGTGAGTAFALQSCGDSPLPVEYTYTDVSAAFLRQGRDTFAEGRPWLTFTMLDIEVDPVEQGLSAHSYDVVLATNVLHATADIRTTLSHVRQLLRPGGLVLINEVTRADAFTTITFGLTPGWWRYRDAELREPLAPLLSPASWRAVLSEAGFDQVRALGYDAVPEAEWTQCVFTAAACLSLPGIPRDRPAGRSIEEAASTLPSQPEPVIGRAVAIETGARDYVREVFAEVLRFEAEQLDDDVTFENFGVDSLVSLNILARFEQDLGPLPSTLLFEQLTITALASHLLDSTRLPGLLTVTEPAVSPARVEGSGVLVEASATRSAGIGEIAEDAVAVVGLSGRYPGAPDIDSLWKLLRSGASGVTEVPPQRWNWRDHVAPEGNSQAGRWGGFIDGVDQFDPAFFGILAREAADIDPQERLFLEVAWNVLEEAGYLGETTRVVDTGVFVGTMYGSYGQLAATGWADGQLSGATSAYWSIANRVSYALDLQGPSFAVDSACSSSLLAVHLACESIRRGDCTMAVAGGVNVILHPSHMAALTSLNMLAADGRCKSFDAAADGFVPGEGVGAVLLKPLAAALADGDRIWGVIRGGSMNAGGKTGGYTVPNPNAQAELIRAALRRSGIDPASIGYVEAHGTGTQLGDPIELRALQAALGPDARCAVGSAKANLGHLEGAAGIAGLTRALLQLRYREIAPCGQLSTVNPRIGLAEGHLELPRQVMPWPAMAGTPRRAGVSSFGAGGANVHLILEEAPPTRSAPVPTSSDGEVFLLSARTADQLRDYAASVAAFTDRTPDTLAELCSASQIGRRFLAHRLAVRCRSVAELGERLRAYAERRDAVGVFAGHAEQVAAGTRYGDGPPASMGTDPAQAWVTGARVDWAALRPGPMPARAPFPTYPFQRSRHWLEVPGPARPGPAAERAAARAVAPVEQPAGLQPGDLQLADLQLEAPGWQPEAIVPGGEPPRLLLLLGTGPLDAELREVARQHQIAVVAESPADAGGEACEDLVGRLAARGGEPDAVIVIGARGPELTASTVLDEFEHGLHRCIQVTTALLRRNPDTPLRVLYGYPADSGLAEPQHAAVAGALRSLCQEHSALSAASVGLDSLDPAAAAAAILAELRAAAPNTAEVLRVGSERLVKKMIPAELDACDAYRLPAGASVLITGGAGAVGLLVAEHLVATAERPVIVLAGRSLPDEAALGRMAAMRATGAAVRFERTDVTDPDQVRNLIRGCGDLTGLVHAAGIIADGRAVRKTAAQMNAVLAPKVIGVLALDEATAGMALDFFTVFSSVVAETGNIGQSDYAAAGAFVAGFILRREALRRAGLRHGRSTALEWPLWHDGGMRMDEATRRRLAWSVGMAPLPTEAALAVFDRAICGPHPVLAAWQPIHRPGGQPAAVPVVPGGPAAGGAVADLTAAVLRQRLQAFAAAFLMVDPVEVSLTDDLLDTGFDSITLTELINEVNETYGLDLLPTVLFECATLDQFADYLLRHWAGAVARVESVEATRPMRRAADPVQPAAPDLIEAIQPPARAAQPAEPADPDPVEPVESAQFPDRDAAALDPAGGELIAVVGLAATLPGSADAGEFWRHLVAGDDLIGTAPADRLELHAAPGTRSIRGGFLENVGAFDAGHFRISAAEAALMDPQQRLFLQAVWHAIEDSGHRPDELAGTDTGLFVGVSTTDYADLLRAAEVPVAAHTASGIAHSILANRISHLLDLRGPSEAVDTACSSSLVAIHRAVQAIRSGECRVAVVGGVNALLSPGLFDAFEQSGMLSSTAACRSFSAAADGYVRGEGAGAIVLKSLSAAREESDHIYAIVRASSVGHGGRTASLTSPSPRSQADVLLAAYRRAGVDPRAVSAIEAHGTGTKLGDPVEFEGLRMAFAELAAERGVELPNGQISLGTVKSNVGHLEAASGIAGVLKMLLALRHGYLPATLNSQPVNPMVRIAGTPFTLADAGHPWQDGPAGIRVCGVSSFGFGGTNGHLVLESAPGTTLRETDHPGGRPALLVLSHDDPQLLRQWAGALAEHLERERDCDLAGLAYTLQVGRAPRAHRLAALVDSRAEALAALRAASRGHAASGLYTKENIDAQTRRPAGAPVEWTLLSEWLGGADVDWAAAWSSGVPQRVALPPRPFRCRSHWFDNREPAPMTSAPSAPSAGRPSRPARAKLQLVPVGMGADQPPLAAAGSGVRPDGMPRPQHDLRSDAPVQVPAAQPAASRTLTSVTDAVLRMVIEVLDLDATEPDFGPESLLSELGLDSIYRMELARRVNRAFDVELRGTDLYDFDTVAGLVAWVLRAESTPPAPVELAAAELAAAESAPAEPAAAESAPAEPAPAELGQPPAGSDAMSTLVDLFERELGRPLDRSTTFAEGGLTSFDMLRVISSLERRCGTLPKALLFEHPTIEALYAELENRLGAEVVRRCLDSQPDRPAASPPARAAGAPHGVRVVRKRSIRAGDVAAGQLQAIDARWAKEGGLAGRDIAPLAFIGAGHEAYFNFSRRGSDIFAWSYAGSAENFPVLAGEWISYAQAHGLRPNFLAMAPVSEAGGVRLTATPFGAVQRLTDLAGFTVQGTKMQRLRSHLNHFERSGPCRTEEYRPGSDPGIDADIVSMIDRWSAQKQMVNPYVAVVRAELSAGQLAERHRMFLTRSGDVLTSVVIITRIPSEPGWLLDLEFYPAEAPRGGLEFAIVSILNTLQHEGCELFSFGASFGVRVCSSPNPAPEIEQGLQELDAAGIFGAGNFTFKNKFRPVNEPLYLCQPADQPRTALADIILMIADPDTRADAPGLADTGQPEPVSPAPPTGSDREAVLRTGAYNPLALDRDQVEVDLLTDSWAELDTAASRQERRRLRQLVDEGAFRGLAEVPSWLPFDTLEYLPTGRAAEALLLKAWPGTRGVVLHNGLFPTWLASLADAGFTSCRTVTEADRRPRGTQLFQGDLDLRSLAGLLSRTNGGASFVAIELGGNAGGGYPISLSNLQAVRASADRHGVPVVLDATRIVENAVLICEHDPQGRGRPVAEIVTELLSLATAATMSLSKDFGLDGGGLLMSRLPALRDNLGLHRLARGQETSLDTRRLGSVAIADLGPVEARVRQRVTAVAELWRRLSDAGLPVVVPAAAHCVLLDAGGVEALDGTAEPVASLLAWLFLAAGVRGAPHLDNLAEGRDPDAYLRLAVPVGMTVQDAGRVGDQIASAWRRGLPIPDLVEVLGEHRSGPVTARYHPAADLPDDISAAMRERYRPDNDNAAVLATSDVEVRRTVLTVADSPVEVFTAGQGRPVLLMHPFNIGAGVFVRQFPALAERYQLISIHHPGVGATRYKRDLTLTGLAALAAEVLDALGVTEPVQVLGSSFGGLVAQTFAVQHRNRCASLVLVGSSYKAGNRRGELNRLSVVAAEDFDRVMAHPDGAAVDRGTLEPLLLRCESMDPQIGLSYLDVFADEPTLLQRLPEIGVPTLIVHGGCDTVISPKTAHLLFGAIPDARHAEIPGAGHFPCLTHPDQVHQLLLPFLREHEPQGSVSNR
ncbi:alpha/beta fold hydrolase [Jatrophihabitans sp.]|uniref:alpha/beta fold hydrolase n=1 Tax=Jatrophihabitans sp. TaxID=1932789 RepID=UPI002F1701D4